MQLLCCLGSLCHLTAVWSQQKSTIFAFQQFSPTVSLWRVWKCDQCGVYQFAPWKKWHKLAVWFVGGSTTRSLQVRGWHSLLSRGERDGRLWVEKGSWTERVHEWPHLRPKISLKHQEWANLSQPEAKHLRERRGDRCCQCQTRLIILPAFHFFLTGLGNCTVPVPVRLFIPLWGM